MTDGGPIEYRLVNGRYADPVDGMITEVITMIGLPPTARHKIGRTCDPAARWSSAYSSDHERMVLLYKTSNFDRANAFERKLIDFFEYSDNRVGGGGGPDSNRYGATHYIYIVIDRSRRPPRVLQRPQPDIYELGASIGIHLEPGALPGHPRRRR